MLRWKRWGDLTGQHSANDLAGHICQPIVAAAVAISQALVIEAHQVQDRGMEVMDVHWVASRR